MAKRKARSQIANWLLTTKSQESPWFPRVQMACHIVLKNSQWGLQLCFKLHLNRRSSHKVMGLQNHRNPNLENFETPTWESKDKMTFGCWSHGQAQSILQGGRWWFPPSWGHAKSCEFVFAHGLFMHQKCSNYALTNLLLGLCRYV
jgi:hypothetical protein